MSRTLRRSALVVAALAAGVTWFSVKPSSQGYVPSTKNGDWTHYTADMRGTKYSPLDQITAANFNKLEVAWKFKTDNLGTRPEYKLEGTPLAIKGTLFVTAGTRRSVIALDGKTGELIWSHSYREGTRAAIAPRQLSGRGVSYWTDGKGDERVLYVTTGYRLIALNAKNGAMIPSFGEGGVVDLEEGRDGRQGHADRSRAGRDRPALDAHRRQGRRHRRVVLQGRDDRSHAQQHEGSGSRLRRQEREAAVDVQHDSPSRASSATTRGKTSRGRSTATPASGRKSPSMRKPDSSTCRWRRRRRTSTAAIGRATTCSPRAWCAST